MVAKGNPALIGREVTQPFTKEEEGWLYFLRCAPQPILTLLEKKEAEIRIASLVPYSFCKPTSLLSNKPTKQSTSQNPFC